MYLFGVLDGHGGEEVSKVVASKFPLFLKSNPSFKLKNYQAALAETFKEMDQWLTTQEGLNALIEARFKAPIA